MQQILFYLRIHNIGCRIICTLIKLLLRIYTVLGDWGLGIGHRGLGIGHWGDGETRGVMNLFITTIDFKPLTFNL